MARYYYEIFHFLVTIISRVYKRRNISFEKKKSRGRESLKVHFKALEVNLEPPAERPWIFRRNLGLALGQIFSAFRKKALRFWAVSTINYTKWVLRIDTQLFWAKLWIYLSFKCNFIKNCPKNMSLFSIFYIDSWFDHIYSKLHPKKSHFWQKSLKKHRRFLSHFGLLLFFGIFFILNLKNWHFLKISSIEKTILLSINW